MLSNLFKTISNLKSIEDIFLEFYVGHKNVQISIKKKKKSVKSVVMAII